MQILSAFAVLLSVVLGKGIMADEAAIPPFKEQCLKWHNVYRKRHQVDPVTWNYDLAKGAQEYADILAANNTFVHAKGIYPGENLYLSGKPLPEETCTEATQLFYAEVKDYDYNNPKWSAKTGHFTQLVWKKTTEIGAAQAIRLDGREVVVVRYSPPGNFNKKYEENVLPELKEEGSGAGQTRSSLFFIGFVVAIGSAFKTFI